MLLRSCILAFALLLSACAATGVREATHNSQLPRYFELTQTPFFPQQKYHCGPAALSTALHAVDIRVTPDELAPEVYIPSRKGSLQIEMLAAARRHGALPVKLAPRLDALFSEIAAGNVVVVMQNLGLSWIPAWHYAVVVGYDLDKELVWLRSGTDKRAEMTMSTFQRTWARSQYWAFVALKPGSLPASAAPEAMVQALVSFEKTADPAAAKLAYGAAAKRWPDNLVILTGLGNSAYITGDINGAVTAFRAAIAAHPDSAAAYNNLANVLLLQGDQLAAREAAEKALQLAGEDEKLQSQVKATLDEINAYSSQRAH